MPLKLKFEETGGYDCMTGAWVISRRGGSILLVVDQRHYGQQACDYIFRSNEAQRIARICLTALQADDKARNDPENTP